MTKNRGGSDDEVGQMPSSRTNIGGTMAKKLTPTTVQMPCTWHLKNDADIIKYLNRQANRTEAIRIAIREKIEREAQ